MSAIHDVGQSEMRVLRPEYDVYQITNVELRQEGFYGGPLLD